MCIVKSDKLKTRGWKNSAEAEVTNRSGSFSAGVFMRIRELTSEQKDATWLRIVMVLLLMEQKIKCGRSKEICGKAVQ